MLNYVRNDRTQRKAIVLAPCRELILQTAELLTQVCSPHDIRVITCVGGTTIRKDVENIQEGYHVIVGSAGRVGDLIGRNMLALGGRNVCLESLFGETSALPGRTGNCHNDCHADRVCAIYAHASRVDETENFFRKRRAGRPDPRIAQHVS